MTNHPSPPEAEGAAAIACWARLDDDDRRLVARVAPDLAAALDTAIG